MKKIARKLIWPKSSKTRISTVKVEILTRNLSRVRSVDDSCNSTLKTKKQETLQNLSDKVKEGRRKIGNWNTLLETFFQYIVILYLLKKGSDLLPRQYHRSTEGK